MIIMHRNDDEHGKAERAKAERSKASAQFTLPCSPQSTYTDTRARCYSILLNELGLKYTSVNEWPCTVIVVCCARSCNLAPKAYTTAMMMMTTGEVQYALSMTQNMNSSLNPSLLRLYWILKLVCVHVVQLICSANTLFWPMISVRFNSLSTLIASFMFMWVCE